MFVWRVCKQDGYPCLENRSMELCIYPDQRGGGGEYLRCVAVLYCGFALLCVVLGCSGMLWDDSTEDRMIKGVQDDKRSTG